MSFIQNVSNWLLGQYGVLTTKTASNGLIQHMRLDVGVGSAENVVSTANPLPVAPIAGLTLPAYDFVGVAYPTATTEVFTFKTGGSGGTTVAVVTLTYTDSTKENLLSAELA